MVGISRGEVILMLILIGAKVFVFASSNSCRCNSTTPWAPPEVEAPGFFHDMATDVIRTLGFVRTIPGPPEGPPPDADHREPDQTPDAPDAMAAVSSLNLVCRGFDASTPNKGVEVSCLRE